MIGKTQSDRPCIDLSRFELRLDGRRVRLERQPLELLIFFVQHPQQLVTREQIENHLWHQDVFVDVDASINSAIRKIRTALRDDAAAPRYVETVVGKGYRFIGEIDLVKAPSAELDAQKKVVPAQPTIPERTGSHVKWWVFGLFLAILIVTSAAKYGPSWIQHMRSARQPNAIHSVAVLPLENISGDSEQDYFADGMTDELTTDLAKVSSLKVISRTSASRYRHSSKSLKQIAQDLGVDAVVEGSVARSRDKVRITAQLIDADSDVHLWAESYDTRLDDILAVQNKVALEIARQVRARLSPSEEQRLGRHWALNSAAYEAYLKGRYAQGQQSPDALVEGLADFQQAIALDPSYAPAYAGLADNYSLLANYSVLSPAEAFPKAKAAALQALELDSSSAEAHTALGYPESHYYWAWASAEKEYQAAIALSPSYATAHLRYAEFLSGMGRHEEAIAEMYRARELDPLSLVVLSNLGRFLYNARRYDDAIVVLKQTLKSDPDRVYARLQLAMCYEEKGLYEDSKREFELVNQSFHGELGPGYAHFLAKTGQSARARQIAGVLRRKARDSDWFLLAGVYAALGDKDNAFACLANAYAKHDFFLAFLKVSPYLDPLRTDPRYITLLWKLHLDKSVGGHS